MDYLTHTTRTEGVYQILERLGEGAEVSDAELVWDMLRAEGLIEHDGSQFRMAEVDFCTWAA